MFYNSMKFNSFFLKKHHVSGQYNKYTEVKKPHTTQKIVEKIIKLYRTRDENTKDRKEEKKKERKKEKN
jgi:hypothetical protein